MTKAEVISKIADKTGLNRNEINLVVESFTEIIKDTLTTGSNVYLRGFGSFIIKKRAAKVARNIRKGTTLTIAEHYIPAFKTSKEFSTQVKETVKASMVKKDKKDKK